MAQGSSKWHPLHTALIFGELDKAKQVFKASGNDPKLLSERNAKGWACLHFASHSGLAHQVEWLLSLPACDPGIRTSRGETALHLAAARGDEPVCTALLKGGCPAEAVTREGRSALHCSAEMGHLPVTRLLVVGAGLSPATPDSGGSSAAALALAGNHKAVLRLLQKSCPGVPVKAHSKNGHISKHRQSADLSSNSDRGNGRRRRDRRSAAGSGPNTNNKESQQRVTIDADAGSVGTAGRGRGGGRGAAARGVEEAGHRLLKAARIGDTVAMSEILARGEVGVEWVGKNNGWTACMEAAEHGSLEGVCYLVDMGADLERTNKKGLNPLQLSVRSGHLGVAEELLKRGARPNVITKAGLCLRCLAHSTGHGYLADWLFAMGVADGVDGGCVCKGGMTNSVGSADVVSNGNPISRGPAAGGGGGSGAEATTPIAVASAGPGARMGTPPPVALPPPRPTSPAAALTEWLTSLGLGCYEERLVSQGFDTLEAMGTATEADLEAMGFLKGHLRLLLARASSDALSSGGKAPSNGSGGTVATVTAAAEAANSGNVAAADSSVDAERSTRASGGIKLDESMHDSGAVGIAPSGAAGANASPMAWTSVVNGGHTSTPEQHGKGAKGPDHDDSNNGEQQDEDEEGMYCDAQALNPMRMLPGYGSSTDGLNGAGNGGRGDEFKELKPEEVQVDEVIGEGSFGIVRRARWRGMYVAVKELKVSIAYAAAAASSNGSADSGVAAAGVTAAAALAIDDGNRNRSSSTDGEEEMRHEARMLAKVCNHVCVVQFVGVLLRPVPSVVTRFMENGSVEHLLVMTDNQATKELVTRMGVEAAKGVIHLHREGVVHRDLASRNLLLDDGFHVRISDFGFSRVKQECASRGYTRSDMGPIKWTSPEAMRKRCYSEASDAFSFGVVLYEMFARTPPWNGHENLDVAFRVCSGERMTVSPQVDKPVSDLMFRCWEGNPRARPDFASILTALTQFAADLSQEGGDELVEPPPAVAAAGSTGARETPAAQRAAARGAFAADRAERAAKAVAAVKAAAAATAAQQQRQRAEAASQGSFVSSVSSAINSSGGAGSGRGFGGVVGRDGEGDNGARRNSSRPRGGGGDREGAPWQDRWREGRGFPPRSPGCGWGAAVGGRIGGRFGRGGLGRGGSGTSRGESIRKGFTRGSGAFGGEGRRLGGTGTRPIPSRGGGQRGGESGRPRLEREKSDRSPR